MKTNISRENTLAITGLRRKKLGWNMSSFSFNEEKMIKLLQKELKVFIDNGFSNFLTGMADGSDLIFTKAILRLKEEHENIILQAIVPFKTQEKFYIARDKFDYYNILSKCDVVRIIDSNYNASSFRKRNEYLVENSSILIAITDDTTKIRSGTTQTINIARKNNLQIFQVNHLDFSFLEI